MICENCNSKHDGNYGSGRFCSNKCARGFSTKFKRKEINKKVSKKLKGKPFSGDASKYKFTNEDRKKAGQSRSRKNLEKAKMLYAQGKLKRPSRLRVFLLEEQENRCAVCNNKNIWNGKLLVLEVDHIDGNPDNNERNNLRVICPNCHSQTNTFRGRNNGTGNRSYMKKYPNYRKQRERLK